MADYFTRSAQNAVPKCTARTAKQCSTDDICYLKNIFQAKHITLYPELAEKQAIEDWNLTSIKVSTFSVIFIFYKLGIISHE